jgi:hypothetical protein
MNTHNYTSAGRQKLIQLSRTSLIFYLTLLAFTAQLHATTVEAPDFATLVADAEVILQGTVKDQQSRWEGEPQKSAIVTKISLEVHKTLKGSAGAMYELEVIGGTVGETTLEVHGAPKFTTGQTYLLFVQQNGKQVIPLVGMMHGFVQVVQDAARKEAVCLRFDGKNHLGALGVERTRLIGKAGGRLRSGLELGVGGSAQPEKAISFAEFEKEIRLEVQRGAKKP